MKLATPIPEFRAVLVVPLTVFLGCLIAVPVVEWRGDNLPGQQVEEEITLEMVLEGEAARLIEKELDEHSVVSAYVRPRYNEVLFQLFGKTVRSVTVGKDGWLFETGNVWDYPPARTRPTVTIPRTARAIRQVSDWLATKGTHLLVLPVPNKWAIYPHKLPDMEHPPREQWTAIVAALKDAGVWTLDAKEALDPAHGPSFLANDTHWSDGAARRTAEAIGRAVAERLRDEDLPGTPFDGEYVATPMRYRGDLLRMLGFLEGSDLHDSFLIDRTRIVCFDRATKRFARLAEQQPIVLVGTSFSKSFHLAGMVATEIRRRVEDRSKNGGGPTSQLLKLLLEIEAGSRQAPTLVVWEFPEKHLILKRRDFLHALNAAIEPRVAHLRAKTRRPLEYEKRRNGNCEIADVADGWVVGTPKNRDSFITYDLSEELVADGSIGLTFELECSGTVFVKAFFDFGDGFDKTWTPIKKHKEKGRVLLPLEGPDGARIRRIRLDPVNNTDTFRMGPLELVDL